MPELIKEPDGVVADFHVKLQSDSETPSGDPGRSLFGEVRKLQEEVASLRSNVAQLCVALKTLVQLQSVLNQGVQQLVKRDGVGSDCAVV